MYHETTRLFSIGTIGSKNHVIDWEIHRNRDFKRDPNDPAKFERYQAEALIHGQLPVSSLIGVTCHGPIQVNTVKAQAESRSLRLHVLPHTDWYF